MTDIKKKVGEQIRDGRKARGLTQKELGVILGLSESVVSKYETGKQNLSLDTIQEVAIALGMDLDVMIK